MNDGYTIKELMNEVRKEQRSSIEVQARILNSLENIDTHLSSLTTDVTKLKTETTQMKSFVAGISMVIGMVWTAINFVFK